MLDNSLALSKSQFHNPINLLHEHPTHVASSVQL